jgi:hypothetical protein
MTNSNAMNACSIVLYIITERWPGAKKYRDMYEAVKQSVFESIEENKYQPRQAAKRLNLGLFSMMNRNEEGREEVTRMVADMAGEPIPLDEEVSFAASGVDPYIHSYPINLPSQLQATAHDYPQQALFDPSLTSFQDYDFANGFNVGEIDAGTADFHVDF